MLEQHTYDWIKEQVDEIAIERSVQRNRAFPTWCLLFVHQLDSDEAFRRSDTLRGKGGGDGGLDGWYQSVDTKEFHLWQCKWTDEYDKDFGKEPATELRDALENLLDSEKAKDYGQKFQSVSRHLLLSLEHGYKVVLDIGIAGLMNQQAKTKLDKMIKSFKSDKKLELNYEIWDLKRFQQEYEDHHPSSETLENQTHGFKLQSTEIIYMDSNDPTLPEGWEVVVASLNGESLGCLAEDLGSKLFGLNVRFALGLNKRIKSIWESLVDEVDSQYFWLYNNGLTILCDNFQVEKDESNKPIQIQITNPQVVNGCQTVTAFKKKIGSYSSKPSVLARIIKPPSN